MDAEWFRIKTVFWNFASQKKQAKPCYNAMKGIWRKKLKKKDLQLQITFEIEVRKKYLVNIFTKSRQFREEEKLTQIKWWKVYFKQRNEISWKCSSLKKNCINEIMKLKNN